MNPLSVMFGAGVALRNAAYNRGLFKVNRLSRPVISIGNISVGGSGKTPFVMALGELLKRRGIQVDVLSRGYARKATAVAIVDPLGSPAEFGDEPLLIARKLQVPVIVGADRYQAGLLAERTWPAQIHLLDDGFQHRQLHRDVDILMLTAFDLEDKLLPVGRLREPVGSLRRADVLVTEYTAADLGSAIWPVEREVQLDAPVHCGAILFCGVARPQRFFSEMEALHGTARVLERVAFPDHHHYRAEDIERLLRLKAQSGAECFITTEKDEINLGKFIDRLQPLKVARLRLRLQNPERVLYVLTKRLSERYGLQF